VSGDAKSILIPSSAIIGSNIQPQVYLVEDGKAVLQKISISRRIGNKAVIESGIVEGDVIVTSGFINLFDGVNVINSKN
jgi:membrane fusion protein (multidrug efflux system)